MVWQGEAAGGAALPAAAAAVGGGGARARFSHPRRGSCPRGPPAQRPGLLARSLSLVLLYP